MGLMTGLPSPTERLLALEESSGSSAALALFDDLGAVMTTLKANGITFVDPQPRVGGGGHLIAFAHPKSFGGVLVEFVETDQRQCQRK